MRRLPVDNEKLLKMVLEEGKATTEVAQNLGIPVSLLYKWIRQHKGIDSKGKTENLQEEKQLLVKWAKAMGEVVDPMLLEEVERHEQFEKSIIESVRENLFTDLATASKVVPKLKKVNPKYPRPPSLEDLERLLEEVKDELVQTETIEETTLTEEIISSTPAADIVSRVVNSFRKVGSI